jgi:hypothetical protein
MTDQLLLKQFRQLRIKRWMPARDLSEFGIGRFPKRGQEFQLSSSSVFQLSSKDLEKL